MVHTIIYITIYGYHIISTIYDMTKVYAISYMIRSLKFSSYMVISHYLIHCLSRVSQNVLEFDTKLDLPIFADLDHTQGCAYCARVLSKNLRNIQS